MDEIGLLLPGQVADDLAWPLSKCPVQCVVSGGPWLDDWKVSGVSGISLGERGQAVSYNLFRNSLSNLQSPPPESFA